MAGSLYRFPGAGWCTTSVFFVLIVRYASACVLRNKMTCAMELDYSEEEVRNVNLTLSLVLTQLRPAARHWSRLLDFQL